MKRSSGLEQYKTISVNTAIVGATPHRMVSMLLEGALDRISAAKCAIRQSDIAKRGELISKAIAIVDSLRASLNHEAGEGLAANLASLYDYIEMRLVQANAASDLSLLEEVHGLLTELKSGWDDMPPEYQQSA